MMMKENQNIILIGMPGVGKSTVGVLLAKRLKLSFLDTDILIQTCEEQSLQEIIQGLGSEEFCDLEARHIRSVSIRSHVIATGGSVVYRDDAMAHLGKGGVIVHLDLAFDFLEKRLGDLDARGVVIGPDELIADLYAERQPLYQKFADICINTDGLSADQVVGRIITILESNN